MPARSTHRGRLRPATGVFGRTRSASGNPGSVSGGGIYPATGGKALTQLPLLHRDALRQVARLVDVGALEQRDAVGEELDRDRGEERRDEGGAMRHRDAEGETPVEPRHPG